MPPLPLENNLFFLSSEAFDGVVPLRRPGSLHSVLRRADPRSLGIHLFPHGHSLYSVHDHPDFRVVYENVERPEPIHCRANQRLGGRCTVWSREFSRLRSSNSVMNPLTIDLVGDGRRGYAELGAPPKWFSPPFQKPTTLTDDLRTKPQRCNLALDLS